MDKKSRTRRELVRVCISAMLLSMSVVIGYASKSIFASVDGLFRISLDSLPIIIAGILLGPLWGGAIGAASDLVTYFITPQAFAPIPLVTVGYAMLGIVSGILARYVLKKEGNMRLVLSTVGAHLIGSTVFKVIGLYSIYGALVFIRIPIYILVAAVESLIICLLFKSRAFKKVCEEFKL